MVSEASTTASTMENGHTPNDSPRGAGHNLGMGASNIRESLRASRGSRDNLHRSPDMGGGGAAWSSSTEAALRPPAPMALSTLGTGEASRELGQLAPLKSIGGRRAANQNGNAPGAGSASPWNFKDGSPEEDQYQPPSTSEGRLARNQEAGDSIPYVLSDRNKNKTR